MRTHYFFFLIASFLFIPVAADAQTPNFNETWQEFLTNQKISNISGLPRPDKAQDQPAYAKYLLMNTNSRLCQSQVENAESLMAEIATMDAEAYTPIPGFMEKMEELKTKIDAYYSMDEIWKRFLQTKEVTQEELEAVPGAKMSCEKTTLAKYSYMTAYNLFCRNNISGARNIFENRTLKLIEQTDLRIEDVQGLAPEAAKMKRLFRDLSKLDLAWNTYVQTGVSPGFDIELPLFSCNPIPNMKEWVLKGAVDICQAAPAMLAKIKQLQAGSGVVPDGELKQKLTEMEAAVEKNNANLATLNEAWAAFLPNNVVRQPISYGYEYCTVEPMIRAYIMDGFAYGCAMAADMLQKIEALLQSGDTQLEQITLIKISELVALNDRYQANGVKIESLWQKFVAQGDRLSEDLPADLYCDNIHQVKAWTIKGLSVSCEDGQRYLEQIDDFDRTFEFNFTEEVECRVQKLRIKIWDCRYSALQKLARVEASGDAYEARLKELMAEYGMGERPEPCSQNK
jgi:hypothetical protein